MDSAIVTLCQYVIVTLGVVYALSSLGVEWSKLQWLGIALPKDTPGDVLTKVTEAFEKAMAEEAAGV